MGLLHELVSVLDPVPWTVGVQSVAMVSASPQVQITAFRPIAKVLMAAQ